MRRKLRKFAQSPLIKGTAALFWGAAIVNVANYLFNLIMGRMLGPVEFGTLTAVLSILYILGVFSGSIQVVATRFGSECYTKKDDAHAKYGFLKLSKFFGLTSIAVMLLIFAFSGEIATFLNLKNNAPVLVLLPIMLTLFLAPVARGLLYGYQRFNAVSTLAAVESVVKLGVAILLVYLGFQSSGAIIAFVIAGLISYGVFMLYLKPILKTKAQNHISFRKFITFFNWAFMASFGLIVLQSLDVILAKHFLSAHDAGLYAGISLMGKIIYFASSVVVSAMFPLVSERHFSEQKHTHLLHQTLSIVAVISVCGSLLYVLFPSIVVKLFLGGAYASISGQVALFGLAMVFFSLSAVFVNYFLSAHHQKMSSIPLLVIPVMISGFYLFHGSLNEVVLVQLVSTAFLFTMLAGFYLFFRLKERRQNEA